MIKITRDIDALLLVQLVGTSESAADRLRKYEAEKTQIESELELLSSHQTQQRIEVSESAVRLVLHEMHNLLTSDDVKAARDVLSSFVDKDHSWQRGRRTPYHVPTPILTSNQSLTPWGEICDSLGGGKEL